MMLTDGLAVGTRRFCGLAYVIYRTDKDRKEIRQEAVEKEGTMNAQSCFDQLTESCCCRAGLHKASNVRSVMTCVEYSGLF